MELWLVDAFTHLPLTGNPAGVVLLDGGAWMPEWMQRVSREVNASETVFVSLPEHPGADYRLRYFTPTAEVDLCGHATIGSIVALASLGRLPNRILQSGHCTVDTNVGRLVVRVGASGSRFAAEMQQLSPEQREVDQPSKLELLRALDLDEDDVHPDWPFAMCSTGLWDVFVPLRDRQRMAQLRPDFHRLATVNRRLGATSTHVYCSQAEEAENDFHCRDFSPAVGISEDPVTGTATGALMGLLALHGRIQESRTYRFEQGYEMGRPGQVEARAELFDGTWQIVVGGTAHVTITGTLHVLA
ncbi:MAG: PhzF family phenazine biosynthesis protein [Alicyclobacillaceae bacterium]|nr:PhzF family phenazine biosynthesis protein [Alicyclobacillaceae bacterium]